MFRHIRWRLLATYLIVVAAALVFLGVHLDRQFEAALAVQGRESVAAQAQVRHVRWVVAWAVIVAMGISTVVGLLLARSIAGPVQEMQRVAGSLARGRLSERVPLRTQDELGDLARALNSMAGELERLDASRRAFVADASHELRTPVANLVVAVEALKATVGKDASITQAVVQDLEREAHRLRELVERLLDLSQAESGQLAVSLEPVAVGPLAERAVLPFRAQATAAGVEIEVVIPPRLPMVEVDAIRAEQVLANLLGNAVKFTPPGGRVVVEAAERGAQVVIEVSDTGPGVPEEERANIFDRFYKVDKARPAGRGGAGLGLAIAKRLVDAQGGSIEVRNREGGGAVFSVAFRRHG
ncbi:MAG TPA: ATP-binding protein [bacterium]